MLNFSILSLELISATSIKNSRLVSLSTTFFVFDYQTATYPFSFASFKCP